MIHPSSSWAHDLDTTEQGRSRQGTGESAWQNESQLEKSYHSSQIQAFGLLLCLCSTCRPGPGAYLLRRPCSQVQIQSTTAGTSYVPVHVFVLQINESPRAGRPTFYPIILRTSECAQPRQSNGIEGSSCNQLTACNLKLQ